MNPLLRHRDVCVVKILSWLDVIVKTCGGFTNTGREMVVVGLQEGHADTAQNIVNARGMPMPGRAELTLNRQRRCGNEYVVV